MSAPRSGRLSKQVGRSGRAERAKRSNVPAFTVQRKARRAVSQANLGGVSRSHGGARRGSRRRLAVGRSSMSPHSLNAGAQSDRVRAKAMRELWDAVVAA